MKSSKLKILLLLIFLQLRTISLGNDDQSQSKFHKEIQRKDEKELKVKIIGGIGAFYILPGTDDKIAIIDGYFDKETGRKLVDVNYFVEDGVGYLEFEMQKVSSKEISKEERWYIKLCKDIPTTLEIELGATKADIELGELSLKNLKISTGVSKTNLKFTKPNQIIMRKLEIETGVAKFDGENLGNAKFRSLNFSGGMGDFKLDLSGELLDDANINISMGFGNLDLYLPNDVGAVIKYSGFLSSKKFENFYKMGDEFISSNIDNVQKKVNIYIDSGLGNVRVRWVE